MQSDGVCKDPWAGKVDAASGSFQGHLFSQLLGFRVAREDTEVGTVYLRTVSGFTHFYEMFLECLRTLCCRGNKTY